MVTAKVPRQILLRGESARITAVISGFNQGGYQLPTQFGILDKRFSYGDLNRATKAQQEVHSRRIPIVPMKDGEVLKITLPNMLQALHRRKSVEAAQK